MMEALVALALFSVFGQTLSFQCPRSNVRGLFADPEDCSKYYQCVDGGRYYPKNCPPGLWFDSRYSICNWPGYVSCNARGPEIQPLASEESDPVLTGTIRRYPQKLGRQVHTTRKRSTYHTKPTTYPVPKRTTTTTTMKMIPESTTYWTSMVPEFKTRAPLAPQAERTAQHLQGTTTDPSPGPISSSQSVLDWLYQDNVLYDDDEPQVENAHPQAPPKSTAQSNPINSVASLDEYGGFEDEAEYQDTGFEPVPECSAAFSLQLDPTRCEGFYQCYLWIPYPKVCPAGLLFDHQSNVCNWPEYVYCLNGERYDPPETTTMDEIVTMPPNPPAPSNNFNPQGNGGFREDNNYDDYWPIEGVMEGQHHQTAFKKKVLPVDSSQISDETYEKRSTPKIKATTLMMYTDSMATTDECGSDGCYSSKKVKTSDYKIQPIMTKKEPVSTTATTTIRPATIAVRLAKLRDSESKSLSDSLESSSQSDSTSNETWSNESSFSSSEEEHNSAESLHSSAEDNEIVKPELTSNKLKIKENEIEVEIVEVKISDGESKTHQDESGAKNATSTKKTRPTPKSTSAPRVTPANSAEENSSDTISSEDSDETENYSSSQLGDNSTESYEGSGSAPVLSKIDTLRNSVEKLITDETPTPPVKNNNLTKTATPTTEKADLFANATAAPNATTMTAAETTVSVLNTTENVTATPNEKSSAAPKNANDSIDVPQSVNTTENVTTVDNSEKLDSNITYVNVSVAADVKAEKSVDDEQKNTSNPDSISLKNQTENSTLDTIVPDENITVTNVTIGNDTTFGLNVSVEQTSTELQLNSTDNVTQATTLNQTSTEPELLTSTTQSSSSSAIPLTTKCSGSNCKPAKSKSTTTKAQPATHISHSARKAKARRPGIVMLSGKSPIARILEKLLNIRMKQIGNNKFKAVEATKQSVKEREVPSENKIKSSPKSQNDEARTANPKATLTTDAKTSVYASKVTTRKSSKAPVTSTTKPTTKATVASNGNTTEQSATGAENITISIESDVNDLENTSMSVMNTTDLPGNETSNSTVSFKPSTQFESNSTKEIIEKTTSEFTNSSKQTTTMKTTTETIILTTINSEMKNVSVAVAENTQKETKKGDTKTTAALKLTTVTTVTTTTGKTTLQSLSTPKLENSTMDTNITRPVPNTNETSNSSVKADDIYIAKMDLNTTDIVLNITGTSNTSISTNESASTTSIPIYGNTTKQTAGVNKTITIGTIEKATTTNLVSSGNNSSSIENSTTLEVSSNATSSIVSSTPTTTPTSTTTTTTTAKAASTEETLTNTTTDLPTTTAPKTSRKQRRETHKPARKPTHFRQRANAPHFEARKVFGGPDEKWRFSDGTLVDQFSRQQRDVDMMNEMSSAYHLTPSLVLITVLLFLCNQLA